MLYNWDGTSYSTFSFSFKLPYWLRPGAFVLAYCDTYSREPANRDVKDILTCISLGGVQGTRIDNESKAGLEIILQGMKIGSDSAQRYSAGDEDA